jgi:ubiquinone/menaquinone biosynthesis C-methylase UbiE
MGLERQGAKPTGKIGMLIGRLMNCFQTGLYIKYIDGLLPPDRSKILDIGCGGGKFVKYLSQVNESYKIYGIDHSREMIVLSGKVNQAAIKQNRVILINSSATKIPLDSNQFNLITALETVQFWPDINKSFKEMIRLLKIGGLFLIINRYPDEGSKWWKRAVLKNYNDYRMVLTRAGFSIINIDLNYKNGWIILKATKCNDGFSFAIPV